MRKILFVLILLLPWTWKAVADNVPQQRAAEQAAAFFRNAATAGISQTSAPSLKMIFTSETMPGTMTRTSSSAPAFYVFDNASGPGFVIISGDDAAMPVLGYSFENEFPEGKVLPPNLASWLEGKREEIIALRAKGIQPSSTAAGAWSKPAAGDPVVDMETALWNQDEPYNLLCPEIDNTPTYTGCTATALAIIMRYHQWPEKGTGVLPGYTTTTYSYSVPSVTLGYEYDWENMLMEYSSNNYDDAQANAVATLMRDCGVMLESDYGPYGTSGTGAYSYTAIYPLAMNMGYDKSARYVQRGYYEAEEWYAVVKNELDCNRPLLFTGYNSEAGHAFVLDGYTEDNYFSVNWGWGGMSNGYFLLDALDPSSQGAGGSSSGYNQGQGAIIGIQKDAGGEFIEDMRYSTYSNGTYNYVGLSVDSPVEQGKSFTLHAGLFANASPYAITGANFMFAVVDADGNIVQELKKLNYNANLDINYGYALDLNDLVINDPIRVGWRIRGFFTTSVTTEWTVIGGSEGTVWDLVIFDESMTIEANTSLSYDKKAQQLQMTTLTDVTAVILDADGTEVASGSASQDGSLTLDTSGLESGTYTLRLENISDTKEITIYL